MSHDVTLQGVHSLLHCKASSTVSTFPLQKLQAPDSSVRHRARHPSGCSALRQPQVRAHPQPSEPRNLRPVQPFAEPRTSAGRTASLPLPLATAAPWRKKKKVQTDLARTLCRSHLSKNHVKCDLLHKAVPRSLNSAHPTSHELTGDLLSLAHSLTPV